jgi:hypothetical protein
MFMLDNARVTPVTLADLKSLPTPEPTESWMPIAHHEVVDRLTRQLERRHLAIRAARMTVADGALYPEPGRSIEVPGARLFASFDLEPTRGVKFPEGCIPSLGLRNSVDKSYSLSVLAGARVLVCSNGVLSAEFIVSRKHTSGIRLNESIDRALDQFMNSVRSFGELHERLRMKPIGLDAAKALVVDCAIAGALPSSHVVDVVREFDSPSYEAFESQRNLWGLYNSITHSSLKRMSAQRAADAYRALNNVLVGAA